MAITSTDTTPSYAWIRPVVLIAVILILFVGARVLGIGERIGEFRGWIDSLGFWGYGVFVTVYVTATVLAVPGSAITVLAGSLFGSVMGTALVSIASTLGASLSFLIARYVARDAVAAWLANKPSFARLDSLAREQGPVIVALTRLVPLFPFNMLNYGFGLTGVRFADYVLWSWLCMLPGTVLYVAGADAVTSALAEGRVPWVPIILAAGALVLLAVIVRTAKRRLTTDSPDEHQSPDTPESP